MGIGRGAVCQGFWGNVLLDGEEGGALDGEDLETDLGEFLPICRMVWGRGLEERRVRVRGAAALVDIMNSGIVCLCFWVSVEEVRGVIVNGCEEFE